MRTRTAKRSSRLAGSQLAVIVFKLAIHEHVIHTYGKLRGVDVGGAITDRCWIKDGNVRIEAGLDQPTIRHVFPLCRHGSDLPNGFRKGHEVLITNVTAEEAGHRAKGARMRMRLEKGPIQRKLA